MKELSDEQLINNIKKGNKDSEDLSESFLEICHRHKNLFYQTIYKYTCGRKKIVRDDFLKDIYIIFYKSIMDFNEAKNSKFSTYLANRTKWMCINDYHKNKKEDYLINIEDSTLQLEDKRDKTFDLSDVNAVLSKIKKEKDKRLFRIFNLRYCKGEGNKLMPWRQVCKNSKINLSVQGCINVHNNYINKIKVKGKRNGFLPK
jgi:RNA polymerase sigma factor (sigma-70 family)